MEFWKSVTDPETRVFGAADGEEFDDPSLHRFCLIHPCDRQTDRRTDRIAMAKRRAIAVPAVARKNFEL